MLSIGKPAKIVVYKNLRVRLYQAGALARLLGRSKIAVRRLEKDGFIPRPMFVNNANGHRFYTDYELMMLSELSSKVGIPYRFIVGRKYRWCEELRERWAYIRSELQEGREPELGLYLHFHSRSDLKEFLRSIFRSLNAGGDVFIDRMTERFLERQTVA